MKNYFIVNPSAGKGKDYKKLAEQIENVCRAEKVLFEIYITKGVGDAEDYARSVCERSCGDKIRFFACGGDGTLCEVVNGIVNFENAAVGIIPIGTGNDFVRNFTNKDKFFDISSQLKSNDIKLDLLRYNDKYCANMINIGFDGEVVAEVAKIKRNAFVPTKLAYIIGVIIKLIELPWGKAEISLDGGKTFKNKEFLLSTIANGRFCGGGFKSNPVADFTDGLMDICLVNRVSRLKFISIVDKYKKGTHLQYKKVDELLKYFQCMSIEFKFPEMRNVIVDGEVYQMDSLHIESVRGKLNFLIPLGIETVSDKEKSEAIFQTGKVLTENVAGSLTDSL